ncbi:uncharacterized protein K444DRAFT_614609, partial [Hyaloscypha bicolor E]
RNTLLVIWDADGRPEAEKEVRPRAPRLACFNNIKEEYSFRLKEYSIKQSNWLMQSSRENYNRILDRSRIALIRAQTYRVTEQLALVIEANMLREPKPVNCSILELAVRERLVKGYEKLYGQLEKKG